MERAIRSFYDHHTQKLHNGTDGGNYISWSELQFTISILEERPVTALLSCSCPIQLITGLSLGSAV